MSEVSQYNQQEIDIVRRLAERKARIAADPVNIERRNAWYAHDAGPGGRPMILAEIAGIRDKNRWLTEDDPTRLETLWALPSTSMVPAKSLVPSLARLSS